ncbi:hypothetical protein [Actinophytocola sp.]|jgi:hypothetical protein|uniref:hypothetical protein n=1 Tax=Actinophytocola sp. TaxID=1872138 RepID=UPI002ED8CA1B
MPACDICDDPPGPDAKRYTAKQLRAAVDSGYRPRAVIEGYRAVAGRLGLDLGDDHWFGEWVGQVRRDRTDWVLCRTCATGLDDHLGKPAGGPPPPPRGRGLFGRRR